MEWWTKRVLGGVLLRLVKLILIGYPWKGFMISGLWTLCVDIGSEELLPLVIYIQSPEIIKGLAYTTY